MESIRQAKRASRHPVCRFALVSQNRRPRAPHPCRPTAPQRRVPRPAHFRELAAPAAPETVRQPCTRATSSPGSAAAEPKASWKRSLHGPCTAGQPREPEPVLSEAEGALKPSGSKTGAKRRTSLPQAVGETVRSTRRQLDPSARASAQAHHIPPPPGSYTIRTDQRGDFSPDDSAIASGRHTLRQRPGVTPLRSRNPN